jgi:hypothetical protein
MRRLRSSFKYSGENIFLYCLILLAIISCEKAVVPDIETKEGIEAFKEKLFSAYPKNTPIKSMHIYTTSRVIADLQSSEIETILMHYSKGDDTYFQYYTVTNNEIGKLDKVEKKLDKLMEHGSTKLSSINFDDIPTKVGEAKSIINKNEFLSMKISDWYISVSEENKITHKFTISCIAKNPKSPLYKYSNKAFEIDENGKLKKTRF